MNKLEAVGLGILDGPKTGMDFYQGIKNKPVADYERQIADQGKITANEDARAQIGQRQGQENRANAQAELDRQKAANPPQKPEDLRIVYADAVQEAIAAGRDPRTDPKVQSIADSITSIQPERAPKEPKEASQEDRDSQGWIDAHKKDFKPDASGNYYIRSNMTQARIAMKGAEAAAGRDPAAAADRAAAADDRHTAALSREEATREKAVHPYKSKVDSAETAKDYLASGAFTGPSDEALMLQFFNSTKPESGFRLTQTEQNMLENARTWFGSYEAKYLHATKGTYFSEEQRKQIVDTMTQMASRAQQNIEDYDSKHGGNGPSAKPATAGGGKPKGNDPLGIR